MLAEESKGEKKEGKLDTGLVAVAVHVRPAAYDPPLAVALIGD